MSLAIGGAHPQQVEQNPFRVNVLDFGARSDGTTDNTAAFQTAVDYLAAKIADQVPAGLRTVGTVFIPASVGTYMLGRPIWVDSPFIVIRGEGQGTRVACYPNKNHSLFIFGLRRTVTLSNQGSPRVLKADRAYRPDLFGRLDTSAAPAPGSRWGFRSHGDALIQSQVSPLVSGCRSHRSDWTTDNWSETRALTIEMAIEGPDGPIPGFIPIFGIGTSTSDYAYPLIIYTDGPNNFIVRIGTQSVAFGPQTNRRFGFSSGSAVGVQRIALQIDLDGARVAAYVNGIQVATTEQLGADWGPALQFAENDLYPLLIADNGGNRPSLGRENGFDFSLYGLLFSRSLRYKFRSPGMAQERQDGQPINDLYRYFTPRYNATGTLVDPGMIGYIAFQENPDTGERVLEIQGGGASNDSISSAYLLHALLSSPGGITDNGIHDLHLIGGHLYGQNIAVGQVLDLAISGIRSTDSFHAIGSLANGANYTVRVENCVLDATDSGYFGLDQCVWMRNITYAGAGRATMRFAGCVVHAENCFVGFWAPNNQSTIKIHASDYGGNYTFANVMVDYEGDGYAHTAIYCEAHPYASSTSLVLNDIYLGSIGNASVITLADGLVGFPPAYINVQNLQTYTSNYKALLEIESSKWKGEIRGVSAGDGVRVASLTPSQVAIRESITGVLPRDRRWAAGAHSLELTIAAPGHFTEWKCVQSGVYGTPIPPKWCGLNPCHSDIGQISAYVFNHGYITANLS